MSERSTRYLNLAIVAHVDAGKTSLTERLLHETGVIEEIGRVDDGTTQTDSLALERQRGITIKAAVVSFEVDDITVNLIDTPGHSDFIAEVERALSVLDGAVLVVSAVEGVQAQTRVLMRTLGRLGIPTMIFVNKIDRTGAGYGRILEAIADALSPSIVAMGEVRHLGERDASFRAFTEADHEFVERLAEALADQDDALLAAYVADDTTIPYMTLRRELASQVERLLNHPVYFGSAMTGAGTEELTHAIAEFLPTPTADPDGAVSGKVFKVERTETGEKVAFVRMFSGTIRIRDRLQIGDDEWKVTDICVFENGKAPQRDRVVAGQIAKVWGLHGVRIGDVVGEPPPHDERHLFAPPTLETVVTPVNPDDRGRLRVALDNLAEQDPMINLRQDDEQLFVSLYGEVQKEVIHDTLMTDFGVDVHFRESTTICIERPSGTGAADEVLKRAPNPFLATIGLRIEPAPIDSGVKFELEVELGSMPIAFFRAVQASVDETLRQGLYGWQVTDCTVTMTHRGYLARQSPAHGTFNRSMSSTAADFRNLTPLVLMEALRRAGTQVYQPMLAFQLEVPAVSLGTVLPVLGSLQAIPDRPAVENSMATILGTMPAGRLYELQRELPSLTGGEFVIESSFDHYEAAVGDIPTRKRPNHHPLNRNAYLQHVALTASERKRLA